MQQIDLAFHIGAYFIDNIVNGSSLSFDHAKIGRSFRRFRHLQDDLVYAIPLGDAHDDREGAMINVFVIPAAASGNREQHRQTDGNPAKFKGSATHTLRHPSACKEDPGSA
ncbi:hypothetical protein PAT3040_00610 [Paenibacillus agaridevorans]|uniref:Uncharacterized protein n=1 Tax=Paenibacillus agaridevorans TaxID=171404 RepID=A0A2R5EHX3_9BACL|nr:hypothetical protein PAT3040_00610 [Paenibacillus agaridevorans]